MSFGDDDDDDDNGDGDGLIAPKGDRLAAILIHVGATRKGIKRLERDFADVRQGLEHLRESTVDTEACRDKHESVQKEVDDVKGDIRALKKGTTGLHPHVPAAAQAAIARGDTGQIQIPGPVKAPEQLLEELLEERKNRARRNLNFWLGLVISVGTILGGVVFGLIKVGRYLDRVDRSVESSNQHAERLREELRKELARPRPAMYLRVPITPDAGASSTIPRKGALPRQRPR